MNFHQLIVVAPVFIKYVLYRQYAPAAVSGSVQRPFDELHIYLQQTLDFFFKVFVYIENLETALRPNNDKKVYTERDGTGRRK